MTIVADVLATFRGDTSDLEASANRANAAVGGVHDSASGLDTHFSDGARAASDFAEKVGVGSAAVDELGRAGDATFGSLKQALLPIIGVAGLGGLLDMAKNTTIELQTLGVQFNAAFGASGQSALKTAISDADQFGVSIQAAGSAYQGLGLVTKGTSTQIQSDFKAAADGAAGLGMSVDSVAGMLTNYYQLVQRVGGTGGTANRAATALLTSNLIDPATANQLRLQANQGANAQSLLDTINADIESRFGGAGKAQANTLGGQIQTFKNQFSESTQGALSPLTNDLQGGLSSLNKTMDSQGFKQATQDVTGFVAALAHGVEIIGPFAKTMAEVALTIAALVSHVPLLAAALGVVVAAFLALKAIDIAQTLYRGIGAMSSMASGEQEMSTRTTALTATVVELTAALQALSTAQAESGMSMGVLPGGAGVGSPTLNTAGLTAGAPAESTGRLAGLTNLAKNPAVYGGAALIGSQVAGNAFGGSNSTAGAAIQDIGGGAAIGTMIDPGIGTAIGAAAGLVVDAFQSASQASAAYANAVNSSVGKFEKDNPTGTTMSAITSHLQNTLSTEHSAGYSDDYSVVNRGKSGYMGPNAIQEVDVHSKELEAAMGASYNAHRNLTAISGATGLSKSNAESFAASNNIDLSQNYQANKQAIDTASAALLKLGGASQFSAEQVSSAYNTIASQVSGQYGEQSANAGSLLSTLGKATGMNSAQSQSQFFSLAKQAGIDLNTMGITPQSLNATSVALPGGGSTAEITPQEAQLKNQMLSVTLQYTQALQGEAQAAFAVGQAEFSLSQAYFSQSQAVFSAEQAMFSFGRAILANTVAQVTQTSASAATATALTSGYLPANANVAASLAQVTSLTTTQITAINSEVASYNSLEAAMYGSVGGAQSLFAEYTTLQGVVQTLQAETQQYQNLLNEPLDGSKQYSAQQEQYKVQEAAVQQQIDQLEAQRVPTEDPRIKTLQAQLALLQNQADLSTQINTQGVGQQQFNIQQAQLGPSQSYQTQINAATSMGALNAQLLTAQQNLAPVNASYVALNAQLTVAQQRNSAVTGALQAQATADQGAINANNSLITAANGVTVANNGLVTAQNAIKTAAFGVTTASQAEYAAQVAAQQALNTFASTLPGNIATALQEIQGFITSIGTAQITSLQAIDQAATFSGEAAAAALSGNMQLASEYQTLMTMISKNGQPISQNQINAIISPGLANTAGAGTAALLSGQPLAAAGGSVTSGGSAQLHAGEVVIPANLANAATIAAMMGGNQNDLAQLGLFLGATKQHESGGNYSANSGDGAYGAYQFIPGTWNGEAREAGFGGYANGRADRAPATVQDAVAAYMAAGYWNQYHNWNYVARSWFDPAYVNQPGYAPPGNGGLTVGGYGADITSLMSQGYANGGFVSGMGPVPALLHGGEFVLSAPMLSQLNGSGVAGGNAASGGITLAEGAIQVDIVITGDATPSTVASLKSELGGVVEDAFNQLLMKLNA